MYELTIDIEACTNETSCFACDGIEADSDGTSLMMYIEQHGKLLISNPQYLKNQQFLNRIEGRCPVGAIKVTRR